MKYPESWNDRDLLEEEPLRTEFATRKEAEQSRARRGDVNWNDRIVEAICAASGGQAAARAWLDIAFATSFKENIKLRNTEVLVNSETLRIFVEVFWLLWQKKEKDALIYLNKERTKRGFAYCLETKVPKLLGGREPEPACSDPGYSQRFKKGQNRRKLKRPLPSNVEDAYGAEASIGEDVNTSLAVPLPLRPIPLPSVTPASGPPCAPSIERSEEEESNMSFSSDDRPYSFLPVHTSNLSSVRQHRDDPMASSPALSALLRGQNSESPAAPESKSSPPVKKRKAVAQEPSESSDEGLPTATVTSTAAGASHAPSHTPSQYSPSALKNGSGSILTNNTDSPSSLRGTPGIAVNAERLNEPALAKKPCKDMEYGVAPPLETDTTFAQQKDMRKKRMSSSKRPKSGLVAPNSMAHKVAVADQISASPAVSLPIECVGVCSDNADETYTLAGSVAVEPEGISIIKTTEEGKISEDHATVSPNDRTVRPIGFASQVSFTRHRSSKSNKPDGTTRSGQNQPARKPSRSYALTVSRGIFKGYQNAVRGRRGGKPPIRAPKRVRLNLSGDSAGVGGGLAQVLMDVRSKQSSSSMSATVETAGNFTTTDPHRLGNNSVINPVQFQQRSTHEGSGGNVPQPVLRNVLPRISSPGETCPAASMAAVPTISGKRKRTNSHPEDIEPEIRSGMVNPPLRDIRPLPVSLPRPSDSTPLPDAGRVHHSIHFNQEQVDRAVRDAGASGLMELNAPSDPKSNWINEETHDDSLDFSDAEGGVENFLEDPRILSDEIESCANLKTIKDIPMPQAFKPSLPRFPPIWAKSRQEVCESFEWFRSYQGGVYFSNNIVKGYLLSAFAASRDLFHHGGKLIISHGGGKAESVRARDGHLETHESQDQLAQDKSVRALLKNYHDQRPLVLLIDDKYSLFPYDLTTKGCTYAVLGFYRITHVWAEYQPASNEQGRVVRYKFAFQWCDDQDSPWWIDGASPSSTLDKEQSVIASTPLKSSFVKPRSRPTPAKTRTILSSQLRLQTSPNIYIQCESCKTTSPHVYDQGWMCLRPGCPVFWILRDSGAAPATLDYSENFLALLPMSPLPLASKDIRPLLPSSASNRIATSYAFSRGWHCKACGRLSSRFKWEHWECQHCGKTHKVDGKIHCQKEFWKQLDDQKFMHDCLAADSGIIKAGFSQCDYMEGSSNYQTFTLPHRRGKIHLILGHARVNEEANGIFQEYQEQAMEAKLPFRRWPLRSHKCRGPLLTNYFSHNAGEPYQYVGGTTNTVPFEQAPSAVVRALELIRRRIREALGQSSDFNEVLSAAYMERQRMAFHSDAEKGLGPLVASLSLGSAALMHFRLHSQFQSQRERYNSRNAVTLILRHGDVLVMEGAGVQTYYEHTVVPVNFRIAATARHIDSTAV